MKLTKQPWVIIGVIIALIAIWYFFLRKKKTESGYIACGSGSRCPSGGRCVDGGCQWASIESGFKAGTLIGVNPSYSATKTCHCVNGDKECGGYCSFCCEGLGGVKSPPTYNN